MEAIAVVLVIALLVAVIGGIYQLIAYQKCPECRSLVPMKATRCKHCQAELL